MNFWLWQIFRKLIIDPDPVSGVSFTRVRIKFVLLSEFFGFAKIWTLVSSSCYLTSSPPQTDCWCSLMALVLPPQSGNSLNKLVQCQTWVARAIFLDAWLALLKLNYRCWFHHGSSWINGKCLISDLALLAKESRLFLAFRVTNTRQSLLNG